MLDPRFWEQQPAVCDAVASSSCSLDRELDIPAASASHHVASDGSVIGDQDAVASSSHNLDQELDIPASSRSQDNAAASDVSDNQELLDSQETPLAPLSEILNNVLGEVDHEDKRMEDDANLSGVSEPSSDDDSSIDGPESDETLLLSESSNSSVSASSPDVSDDEYDAGLEKLYAGCEYTTDEAILHLMNLYLSRKFDKKSLSSTLALLHELLPRPNNLPKTEYLLIQYLESLSALPQSIAHYYCSACLYYLGVNEADLKCKVWPPPDPGAANDNTPSPKKNFELPISDHICNLFQNHGLADVLDENNPEYAQNCISDVCHGTVYIRVKVAGRYNLTLMLYTDGVQLAESSNASLWPLMFVILEVPPRLRFKYLVVSGVWFDTQKPVMNTFLKPRDS